MRYLLSSVLLILFISCVSYPKKNRFKEIALQEKIIKNPYFSDAAKDYVYKANIEAFGNSFSGIFIVKKLEEEHHRIAFTTEMGNKIFDFTFQGDSFKVNHILKEMDKKLLVNILKNDFRVLVREQIFVENSFLLKNQKIFETKIDDKKFYHFLSEGKLNKVVCIRNGKEKVEFTFSKINDNIAKKVQIVHKNFNLNIVLKAL